MTFCELPVSWTNLNRKILTSPFKSPSSKNLRNRNLCLGPETGFCLRVGVRAGLCRRPACSEGSGEGRLSQDSKVLFSPPQEAASGLGESQFSFNGSFYSVPFKNSLLPTLLPTQYPKILMPEKESKF